MRRRQLLALLAISVVSPSAVATPRRVLSFFWAGGCPHCAAARPFLKKLQQEFPKLVVEAWEVRRDKEGRRRFAREVRRLKIEKAVVPTFVCGNGFVQGFTKGQSERCLRELVERCRRE